MWQLSKEVVAELKEVFMLFDKDEDQKTYKMQTNTSLTGSHYSKKIQEKQCAVRIQKITFFSRILAKHYLQQLFG